MKITFPCRSHCLSRWLSCQTNVLHYFSEIDFGNHGCPSPSKAKRRRSLCHSCRRTRGSWETSRLCAPGNPSSSSRTCGPSAPPWWRTAAWCPHTLWASERTSIHLYRSPSRCQVLPVTSGLKWCHFVAPHSAGVIKLSDTSFAHRFFFNRVMYSFLILFFHITLSLSAVFPPEVPVIF